MVPQIGCRIRTPQADEVADFYRLFARCEALITGLAAERRTDRQAASFASVANRIAEAVIAGDAARAASETEAYLLSVGDRTSALL